MRTAIITGAAQGIGAATATRLARDGCDRFLLIDRYESGLNEIAAAWHDAGAAVETMTLDLADLDQLQAALPDAIGRLGHVDILVNAAGSTTRGGLADTTPGLFDRLFAVNVRAPFFLMQAAAPAMRRGGVIVNVCSMLSYGGPPVLLAYSASKGALVTLTKGAATALKQDGIRVFGINLGWTWTPGEQAIQTGHHGQPEDWREIVGATQPFGRLLMPEDPAGVIAFLASQDAMMMTGAIIDLDQHVAGTVYDTPAPI